MQQINTYYNYVGATFRNKLYIPLVKGSTADSGAIAYNNKHLWLKNDTGWVELHFKQLNDSAFVWAGDTITIHGGGSSSSLTNLGDGYKVLVPGVGLKTLETGSTSWFGIDSSTYTDKIRLVVDPQVGYGLRLAPVTDVMSVDTTTGNHVVTTAQLRDSSIAIRSAIGGGSGTPGGSSGQIQYNNAGSFAGDAGITYNATQKKLTADSATFKKVRPDTLVRQVTGFYNKDTIYWFGDSHTEGIGASYGWRRYSTQVSNFLGYVEKNFGVGGTAMQGNSTIIPNIPHYSASTPGSYLVINFGTNDAIFRDGAPGSWDTTSFKIAYGAWIDTAIARGWPLARIKVIQLEKSQLPGVQVEFIDYKNATRTVALSKGVGFIPMWDLMVANAGDAFVGPDGYHPNDEGYDFTSSVLIGALRGSVKNDNQVVAINDVAEFQTIVTRNLDSASNNTRVIGVDSLGKQVVFKSNAFVSNNSSTAIPDAASISIANMGYSGTAWRSSRLELPGNGSARDLGVAGSQLWNDGTGLHIISYDWPGGVGRQVKINDFGGQVVIGNTSAVTSVQLTVGGSVIARSGSVHASGSFTGGGTLTTTQLYITGGLGGLQAYNHNTSSVVDQTFQGFGGNTIVGSHTSLGSYKFQVNGNSIFSGGKVNITGNITQNNQGASGVVLSTADATYTDNNTGINGTVAMVSGVTIGQATLAAASTGVTYTTAPSLYIKGPTLPGTNVTITNPFALYVATGKVRLGDVSTGSSSDSLVTVVNGVPGKIAPSSLVPALSRYSIAVGNSSNQSASSDAKYIDSIKAIQVKNVLSNVHVRAGDSAYLFSPRLTSYFFGDSQFDGSAIVPKWYRFTTRVANGLNHIEKNFGIGGTKLVSSTAGDSALSERTFLFPTYNAATDGYIFIGYGTNDAADLTEDTATFRSTLNSSLTTLNTTSSWPLNRIVVIPPGYMLHANSTIQARAVYIWQICMDAAAKKGVRFVDTRTAQLNAGGKSTLRFTTDSLHWNNQGAQAIALATLDTLGARNGDVTANGNLYGRSLQIKAYPNNGQTIYTQAAVITPFITVLDSNNVELMVARASKGSSTATQSLGIGAGALAKQTTADANTAFGAALQLVTSGNNNTAVGNTTLAQNVTGADNTAVGKGALGTYTGSSNTAVGVDALAFTQGSGIQNTAVGYRTLRANLTGQSNTGMGFAALEASTGSENTAFGMSALRANTSGNENMAIGSFALRQNTTGTSNSAFGNHSLISNTTGNGNTGLGAFSGDSITTGKYNFAGGFYSLHNLKTGDWNIALGDSSALGLASGSYNIIFGRTDVSATQSNMLWFSPGRNDYRIYSPSTSLLGIGTNNPTQMLDVNGKTRIRTVDNGSPTDTILTINEGVIEGVTREALTNEYIVTVNTTNTTPVVAFTLPTLDGTKYRLDVTCQGVTLDGMSSVEGLIKRGGLKDASGVLTLGTSTPYGSLEYIGALTTASFDITNSGTDIVVRAIGEAATNIQYKFTIKVHRNAVAL